MTTPEQKRDLRLERIRPHIAQLRQGIRNLTPIFDAQTWGLSEISGLKPDIDNLETVREHLSSRRDRSGNVDEIIRRILREFDLYSINDAPQLLSATGCLIDSGVCLGVLRVRDDYHICTGHRTGLLRYQLSVGYRPHTDVMKKLPRCIYEHPGYLAPVEDLLDWIAVDFYTAEQSGDAEDGAVGWLLQVTKQKAEVSGDLFALLAKECRYWSEERLNECSRCWEEVVEPILLARHNT
jgi:hypothetical protein